MSDLSEPQRALINHSAESLQRSLAASFPAFNWKISHCDTNAPPGTAANQQRHETVDLMFAGVRERDNRHWDMVLMVTAAELRSYYQPYALAASSNSLSVAVVSLAQLPTDSPDTSQALQLSNLFMHLLANLSTLSHSPDRNRVTYTPQSPSDLVHMQELSDAEIAEWSEMLHSVADDRLEERSVAAGMSTPRFYLKAFHLGFAEIMHGIRQAEPWLFPLRLSRLSAAALSLLLIFLMTAEVWDLGVSQSSGTVLLLSLVSIITTSAYVLHRQHMLIGGSGNRLTEQIVVSNITAVGVVLSGMLVTYLGSFLLITVLQWLLFSPAVVESWTASHPCTVTLVDYLNFAGFVAAVCLAVGSLGASFEGNNYIRHVVYVDEEL